MVQSLIRGLGVASVGLLIGACSSDPVEPAVGTSTEAVTAATCVTIQRGRAGAVADTFIKENALRVNYGSQPVLRVSARDEALLDFDLSPIPSGAAVTSATLKLFVNGENGDGTVLVHRVLAPWEENTVTYESFRQRFAHDVVAAFRAESRQALKNIDLTPLVTRWLAGTPNHGILLEPGDDHRPDCRRHGDEDRDPTLFVSSEARHASKRPALEVCYTLPVDHCSANPCENGGSCTNTPDGYTCHCAPGYTGTNCEENIDDCSSSPCQNGGVCNDAVGSYSCDCPLGFVGEHCETNVDDCAGGPCQNGGVCTDGIASFTCTCPPGYDGSTCENLIDNCASEPCHNGGACTSSPGGYVCTCAPGYTGTNCEINIDDCVGNACVNGTCVDGLNAYTCACAPDWGGERCNVNLNSCGQTPCLNGGSCTNTFGGYACACAPGFTGTNCEIDINDCAPNPCQNGGLCVDGVGGYSCECATGYVGANCTEPVPACGDGICEGQESCSSCPSDCGGCASGLRIVDPWPAVPQIASDMETSSTFVIGAGTNRLLLVAIMPAFDNSLSLPVVSASYGGKPLTPITSSDLSQRRSAWLGYLKESDIVTRLHNTVVASVQGGGPNLAGACIYVSSYAGVNQTAPITASGNRYINNESTPVALLSSLHQNAGGLGVFAFQIDNSANPPDSVGGYSFSNAFECGAGNFGRVSAMAMPSGGTTNISVNYGTTIRAGVAAVTLNPAPEPGVPSGAYSISPPPTKDCAFGLVSFRLSTLVFSASGSALTVSGAPCVMTSTSASGGTFTVDCMLPGSCDETYSLTGTFTGPDTWTGTFAADFTPHGAGACFDCSDQSWTVAGAR